MAWTRMSGVAWWALGLAAVAALPWHGAARAQSGSGPDVARSIERVEQDTGIRLDEVSDIADFDIESLLRVPVVVAASRRAQSLHEAPAAITVVTAEQIRNLGLETPAQALYTVPGVDVLQKDERVFRLGMRGFNGLYNNRVLTLLDGNVVTDASPAEAPPWQMLPVHVLDIERMEVVRGPTSTLYGANAFSGVVSIRAKRPLNHPGVEAELAGLLHALPDLPDDVAGSSIREYTVEGYAAFGWVNDAERFGLRVSTLFGQPPQALFHNGLEESQSPLRKLGGRLALDLHTRGKGQIELDLTAVKQEGPEQFFEHSWQPIREEYASRASFSARKLWGGPLDLKLLMTGRALEHSDVLGFAFVEGLDFTELVDKKNLRGSGSAQLDLTLLDERLRVSTALEGVTEQTLYGSDGEVLRRYLGFMIDGEIRLGRQRRWMLGAGLRSEGVLVDSSRFQRITYQNLNWRSSLVYRLSDNQDLRTSISSAYRTPTSLQSVTGVGLPDDGEAVPVRWWVARPDLEPENMVSAELGYRGEFATGWKVRATAYMARMSGLIDVVVKETWPLYFADTQSLSTAGLEAQVIHEPVRWLRLEMTQTSTWNLDKRDGSLGEVYPPLHGALGMYLGPWNALRGFLLVRNSLGFDQTVSQLGGHLRTVRSSLDIPDRWDLDMGVRWRPVEHLPEVFASARGVAAHWYAPDTLRRYPGVTGSRPVGTTVIAGIRFGGRDGE